MTGFEVKKRYPLSNEKKLHTFQSDAEGFYPVENTEKAEFVTRFPNTPFKGYYDGCGCVQGVCADTRAKERRALRRDYAEPLDLSSYSCLTVATDVTRFAPGAYHLSVKLFSNNETYELDAPILAECWNTTTFIITGFEKRNAITAMEIGVYNEGEENWAGLYQLGAVSVGEIVDLSFEIPGAWKSFSAYNGSLSYDDGLKFDFDGGAYFQTPYFPDVHNTMYNAPMWLRNTLFFIMKNDSSADKVRIWFVDEKDGEYKPEKSKIFDIDPYSDKKAYFFNFSDVPQAKERLAGFRFELLGGKGSVTVRRITPEEEEPIYPYAGSVLSCTADEETVTAEIKIDNKEDYKKIAVYETFMYNVHDDIKGLTKLFECDIKDAVTAKFPMKRGNMTRLSSQFLAVLEKEDGSYVKIAPRFYIENYRDFSFNPYRFELPDYEVNALDFGAKADAFTDDTDAIQAAIDHVNAHGGGRVLIPYHNTGRYIITNIMMKSNVDLHLCEGVILWQSQEDRDYKYPVFYGHDYPMRNINWTHALHVATYPLIQAKFCKNVKITGKGKIRSMDKGSEEERIGWYPNNCHDRIHCISVGFYCVENVELSDFEVVRSNNYHITLDACMNIYAANVKLHEVKCVSGDGFGMTIGTHHAKYERCFFESNDDAIVMCAIYNDPRGLRWWWSSPGVYNAVHDIEVAHCYLNSGGGKAICFITWGSDDPHPDRQEIYNVNVYDCVLQGGYSVGTWPDNPYNGKCPFDNEETDDWSPVKNVRIFNNEYRSPTDMLCVKPTNFISDTCIRSASYFQNADFSQGRCFWTEEGDVIIEDGHAISSAGKIYQGLYIEKGKHTLKVKVDRFGRVFCEDALTGKTVSEKEFFVKEPTEITLEFTLDEDNTVALGVTGGILYSAEVI